MTERKKAPVGSSRGFERNKSHRGKGSFPNLNNWRAFIVRKEGFVWSIGECRIKSEMANHVNFASAPLPTRRPYPDYGKLPNFHHLSWSATPTNGREPDDFQPRAQIKRLFEESELVCGDSEAIRKFSDKYIVLEKLVAEYVEHLAETKIAQREEKRGDQKGANGTAEPGVR